MIGLSFRVSNSPDRFLSKIYHGIDLIKYNWEINSEEIMYAGNNTFFGTDVLNGEAFSKCIERDSYYLIFADIKAYFVGDSRNEIDTYEDYIESNCQMILLCADSTFIDFYCKDASLLRRVHENCIDNRFEQITIITEENQSRTGMSVW